MATVARISPLSSRKVSTIRSTVWPPVCSVRGDDIYFTDMPNLWRLRDTNGDGICDQRDVLSTGYGVRYNLLGHDLHGLIFGPDGRLYFSLGDRGSHVVTKEGKTIAQPDCGSVYRCDPDGSNLELFATGLRNPQELAFDEYGNLFTGDNNCDRGEPARLVYLPEGGDIGWRVGYQHITFPHDGGPWISEKIYELSKDNTGYYNLPPVGHISSGPAGLAYDPGTGLPEKFRHHFFLCDFRAGPSSAVHSFALKPKGAGYEISDRGTLLERSAVTDVTFGIDGSVYVTDWMGAGFAPQAKGRIYKITQSRRSERSDRRGYEEMVERRHEQSGRCHAREIARSCRHACAAGCAVRAGQARSEVRRDLHRGDQSHRRTDGARRRHLGPGANRAVDEEQRCAQACRRGAERPG